MSRLQLALLFVSVPLEITLAAAAEALPIVMDPDSIITNPAPSSPLRLTLLSADTDDFVFTFRLEPMSGAWDDASHNGFYTIHIFNTSGTRVNMGITIVPNGQTFVGISLACDVTGCFDALKLGAGGVNPEAEQAVTFVTKGTAPADMVIDHSASLLGQSVSTSGSLTAIPEPSTALLLACGLVGITAAGRRARS